MNFYNFVKTKIKLKMKRYYLLITVLLICIISSAQGLKIQSGAELVVSNSTKIVLNGDLNWTNNGSFTSHDSELIFTGNVDQSVCGTTMSNFYDLDIHKTAGDLIAASNFSVLHELQMNSGELDLKNSVVDLGTTGTIVNETEANRIKVGDINNDIGTIQATCSVNNIDDYNPAGLGVLISTDVNIGTITVVRGHKVHAGSGSFSGNSSVARYYEIPNIGQLDANDMVKIHYWQAELNGNTEESLGMYQWVEEGASSAWWTPLDGSVDVGSLLVDNTDTPYGTYFDPPNWYTFNFTKLFTLSSTDNPLPVEFVSFSGSCNADFVSLIWETASEHNNEKFVVERSVLGDDFEEIGIVLGAGESNEIKSYSFYDTDPKSNAYYRLKQVDFNGEYKYSDIINVSCSDISEPLFVVYPNPFVSKLNVMVSDLPESKFVLELYTMEGKLVYNEELFAPVEGYHKVLDFGNLTPETYMIRVTSGTFTKTYKITKY